MKKIVYKNLLVLALSIGFVSCDSSEDSDGSAIQTELVSYGELPQSARGFIEENFPNIQTTKVERNGISDLDGVVFKTYLSNDFSLGFDNIGEIITIDGKEQTLPSSLFTATDFPKIAQMFVDDYYPNERIVKFKIKKGECEIKLSNNTEIEFDRLGNWSEIEAGRSYVPVAVLPSEAGNYLAHNYPNVGIKEVERKAYGYEVKLVNGVELKFTAEGELSGGNQNGNIAEKLPETAKSFLNTHFPNVNVIQFKHDVKDAEYEVKLANGFEIDFDLSGNWKQIDGNKQAIPTAALPEGILNYLVTNNLNASVIEIEKKYYGYDVDLSNGAELKFNLSGEILGGKPGNGGINTSSLPQQAQDFLQTHFANVSVTKLEHDRGDAEYEVDLSNGFEIDFYESGEWKKVEGNQRTVPTAIVPEFIKTYVSQNHANQPIVEIEKKTYGYKVKLSRDVRLNFSINGEFLGSF